MDRDRFDEDWDDADTGAGAGHVRAKPMPAFTARRLLRTTTGRVASLGAPRSRWVDQAVDWYVILVTACFGLTIVLCLGGYAAGLSERAVLAIAAVPAIACAHPGIVAALMANLIVGGRDGMVDPTGPSWNLVFCVAVAPFILALLLAACRKLAMGGWKACIPAYGLACAYAIACVWVCKTAVVVGGNFQF